MHDDAPIPDETRASDDAGKLLQSVLSLEDWERLTRFGRPLSFAKGEAIITRGTTGDCLYVIQEGRVEVSLVLVDGNKAVLAQMGPGEALGELAVLDGGARSADAFAASAEVQLIAIHRSHVLDVLNGSANVVSGLIGELCRRVRNASTMFEVKSEKSARIRIARTLLHLATKWGQRDGAGLIHIPGFSQSELGDFAGITRESVNRQLRLFEDEALIRRDDLGVTLLNVDAIADEAQL